MNGIVKTIAKRCVAEADAAGHKGRKRDTFAFDFMIGATHALAACVEADVDVTEAREQIERMTAMLVSSRGMTAVEDMAKETTVTK